MKLNFLFNVPPTAMVIWRLGHSLVSSDRLEESGIKLGSPGYKASVLSTPQRLQTLAIMSTVTLGIYSYLIIVSLDYCLRPCDIDYFTIG